MKRRQLALVMAVLFPILSEAASPASADGNVTVGAATGGVLKIDGSGTYTVAAGSTFVSVLLIATEQTTLQENTIEARALAGSWSGSLRLVAGRYTVKARVITKNAAGTTVGTDSTNWSKEVTVRTGPSPQGLRPSGR
jgi:hypothetical protein